MKKVMRNALKRPEDRQSKTIQFHVTQAQWKKLGGKMANKLVKAKLLVDIGV